MITECSASMLNQLRNIECVICLDGFKEGDKIRHHGAYTEYQNIKFIHPIHYEHAQSNGAVAVYDKNSCPSCRVPYMSDRDYLKFINKNAGSTHSDIADVRRIARQIFPVANDIRNNRLKNLNTQLEGLEREYGIETQKLQLLDAQRFDPSNQFAGVSSTQMRSNRTSMSVLVDQIHPKLDNLGNTIAAVDNYMAQIKNSQLGNNSRRIVQIVGHVNAHVNAIAYSPESGYIAFINENVAEVNHAVQTAQQAFVL